MALYKREVEEFSTTSFKEWSKVVANTFGGLRVVPLHRQDFSATVKIRNLGNLKITKVSTPASTVWHDGSIGTYFENERFLVKTQVKGLSRINTGVDEVELKPGDTVICDNARSYSLAFDEDIEIITIPLPTRYLERFYATPEKIAFLKANQSEAINRVAFNYLMSLWSNHQDQISETDAEYMSSTYFELLIRGFEHQKPVPENVSTVYAGHLVRCKRYIEENIADPNLCPDMISEALSISKRYLHSIFSAAGVSVSAYIISQRLDMAAKMIRSRRCSGMSVSEIAYACGFKSSAHFARTFKSRFGETASNYRERTFS